MRLPFGKHTPWKGGKETQGVPRKAGEGKDGGVVKGVGDKELLRGRDLGTTFGKTV